MNTRELVAEIMKEVKPAKDLEGVENIVEGGFIDSFELMMLITTLSERFGVEISIDEITPENFNSIDAISAMVDSLLQK
uniref:Phosphopantetheine attachment site n=1 Tax=uncultured bacterium Contig248 TaxID=1393544 RepID=W0FID6_9BACT|nr:phosphopantetheine attachment site [uncultured bacterium Contig248]